MLYYFLLIFNLFIISCYGTHDIVQCIKWITDFTKIFAFHNDYQPRVMIELLHSNTSYCYGKISSLRL